MRPALFVGPSDRHGSRPSAASSRDVGAGVGLAAGAAVALGACESTAGALVSARKAASARTGRIWRRVCDAEKVAPPRPVHNRELRRSEAPGSDGIVARQISHPCAYERSDSFQRVMVPLDVGNESLIPLCFERG